MKNDNLTVLKLFARKLANCRYRVPAETLVDYLNDGKFGFAPKNGTETVVTNEFVFADDIEKAVSHIRAIFAQPHITLQKEDVVQNVSSASNYDSRSLINTIRDEKVWRIKDGEVKPEYIHAYVQEENLSIYENRFISFLIDALLTATSDKIGEICERLKTLNGEIGGYNNTSSTINLGFSAPVYINYAEKNGGIPILINSSDVKVNTVASLVKSKKQLIALKSNEIYKACKKVGNFDASEMKPTNIITHDEHYNYCYNFYFNYFNKDVTICSEKEMYEGFVIVNLLSSIIGLGFKPSEENDSIEVNGSAKLKFNTLRFVKEPFMVSLSQSDNTLAITVSEEVDGNEAKYSVSILHSSEAGLTKFSSATEYAEQLMVDRNPELASAFLISDLPCGNTQNAVCAVPNRADASSNIITFVKTLLFLAEGSEYIHTRYCPVCGSSLVSPDGNDYNCVNCDTLYHFFNFERRTLIWFKRLPKVNNEDKIAISVDYSQNVQDETYSVEEDEENQNEVNLDEVAEEQKSIQYETDDIIEQPQPIQEAQPEQQTESEQQPKPEQKLESEPEPQPEIKVTEEPMPIVAPVVTPIAEIPDEELTIPKRTLVSKSFTGKMCQIEEYKKFYYSSVKNHILSYKRTRSSVSWNFDSFFIGRKCLAKLGVRGKTLVMYVALNPADYINTKYYPHDMGNVKRFAETPMMVKIRSPRAVKFAQELIDLVLKDAPSKSVYIEENFRFPYKSNKQLLNQNLAKLVKSRF